MEKLSYTNQALVPKRWKATARRKSQDPGPHWAECQDQLGSSQQIKGQFHSPSSKYLFSLYYEMGPTKLVWRPHKFLVIHQPWEFLAVPGVLPGEASALQRQDI